jgi:hypothetical protein
MRPLTSFAPMKDTGLAMPNARMKLLHLLTCLLMAGVASGGPTMALGDARVPHYTKIPDHLMMKAGKMVMMHGIDDIPMNEDVILANGTRVQTDGTVTPLIGVRTKLKEGEAITREGRIMKVAGTG